jgi:aldehyde:ferredoxin oxidoreductase
MMPSERSAILYGASGRILKIDLSTRRIKSEQVDRPAYKLWLGGYGLSTRILYEEIAPSINPLAPSNVLGFTTGLLTGTGVLNGNNTTVVGKSPLTGTWGDSRMGAFFGCELKHAGYDAVFVYGRADKPVYLWIDDDECEVRSATNLWGMDTYQTQDSMRDELGDNHVQVACVGPSGEKLSLISSIVTDRGRAAGRSGLGALMGSKNLKAVAVRGTRHPAVFDRDKLRDLTRKWLESAKKDQNFSRLAKYGTMQEMISAAYVGDAPTKNWKGAAWHDMPDIENIAAETVQKFVTRKYACAHCSIGCGGIIEWEAQDRTKFRTHKTEYETLAAFGTMCLNSDLGSIVQATDICNKYGLDTISAGCTIAFAMECYENGIINRDDTKGLDLAWGNSETIVETTLQMARREGFGAMLADGSRVASQRIGKGAEKFAMQVMGQEVPMHDPKLHPGAGTMYVCDATPARHTQGAEWREETFIPGVEIPKIEEKYDATSKERAIAHSIWVKFMHVVNALGMCQNPTWYDASTPRYEQFVCAVTGWEVKIDDLLQCGERIACVRQLFNVRQGLRPSQFKLPDRIAGRPPLEYGPLRGITIDVETMSREYFEVMDWDYETGRPSKKKLFDLRLAKIADDL